MSNSVELAKKEFTEAVKIIKKLKPVKVDLIFTENNLKIYSFNFKISVTKNIYLTNSFTGYAELKLEVLERVLKTIPKNKNIVCFEKKEEKLFFEGFELSDLTETETETETDTQSEIKEVILNKEKLQNGLNKVMFCASKNKDSYSDYIRSVFFDFNSNELTLVATDSYRAAFSNIQIAKTNINSCILSIESMKVLTEILKKSKHPDVIMTEKNKKEIYFKNNGYELKTLKIDKRYPDLKSVKPQEFLLTVLINRELFLNTIKQFLPIENIQLKFYIYKEKMIIEGGEKEFYMKKEIKIKSDNEFITAYNPIYLKEVLEKIDTPEIEVKIGGQVKPTIIKDSNIEYLIMPQRIK